MNLTPWWLLLALAGSTLAAAAEEPVLSSEQIEQALAPPMKTRGFQPRGLARREAAASEQSVNLNVPFELNSSALKPQASEQLKQLGQALSSQALQKDRFVVGGHTDAKGSANYNRQLSLRRAETVKNFLVARGLDPKRLDTVGYGSDRLLKPEHPDDPSNRRVEIRAVSAP